MLVLGWVGCRVGSGVKLMAPIWREFSFEYVVDQTKRNARSSKMSRPTVQFIPHHVIYADNKTRQREIYKHILQRAGVPDEDLSLSCIEPAPNGSSALPSSDKQNTSLSRRKTARRTTRRNQGIKQSTTDIQLPSQSSFPWIGPASQKIISSMASSRSFNDHARPIKEAKVEEEGNVCISKRSIASTKR